MIPLDETAYRWSSGPVGIPALPGRDLVWFWPKDPFIAFWEMLNFVSWVAKRCPHMIVTEVDPESGTITVSSGFGL